jgi:lysophospholipase L1-like esterase
MMRIVAFILLVILAVGSIIVGKVHWNNKISAFSGMESKLVTTERETKAQESIEEEANDVEPDIMKYTNNLPEDITKKIENAAITGEPVNFVVLGSKSTSAQESGWPSLFSQRLTEAYGQDIFDISIYEISDKNSLDVIAEKLYQDALEAKPDLLLFEPFILKDNGEVRMEDRLDNIVTILEEFREVNPSVFILLQPSNPLYNATYYPKEVEELRLFAQNNEIAYLDHWEAWPDQKSAELQSYLTEDPENSYKSIPNDKGHQLWANFLVDYFISK